MRRRAFLVALLVALLVAVGLTPVQAGPVRAKPIVIAVLDELGITENGVYTPPAAGVTNPLTASLNLASYLLQIGGTTSTYPALRYGSSAGVIEFLRADGSAGAVGIKGTHANGVYFESDDGLTGGECKNSGFRWQTDSGDTEIAGQSETLSLYGKTQVDLGVNGSSVALVGSSGLSVVGDAAFALKDVTSATTPTAGYQGVYSLNTNGLQQLTVKGSTGAVTLATQGYYAGGGHFIVSKNADQTFSNAGETVTWTTETTDQPGGVDVSTYNTRVFTAPAAGVVTVTFKIRGAADADPFDGIVKRWNSSDVEQTGIGDRDDAWFRGDGTNAFTCMWTVIRHMDAGDYLTLQVFTPAGIDLDDGGSNATRAAVAAGFFVPD